MAFRICSTEEKFENRLKELKDDFLLPRQYHPKVIDTQFNRIRSLPGKDAIENASKETTTHFQSVNGSDWKTV